jgi:hypothetical protein
MAAETLARLKALSCVLSAASAGERKGPIAKQWEGEVVYGKKVILS